MPTGRSQLSCGVGAGLGGLVPAVAAERGFPSLTSASAAAADGGCGRLVGHRNRALVCGAGAVGWRLFGTCKRVGRPPAPRLVRLVTIETARGFDRPGRVR